jgi:hypothetical protein
MSLRPAFVATLGEAALSDGMYLAPAREFTL